MQRQTSNWLLILVWVPVLALVLGLLAGCATVGGGSAATAAPPHSDLHRLVAQELDADPRFDSFAAVESNDAQRIAAIFRPVLADVNAIDCRVAPANSVDCTLEVVLRFPAMDGRESRTYWDRRLRHEKGGWQLVGRAQP